MSDLCTEKCKASARLFCNKLLQCAAHSDSENRLRKSVLIRCGEERFMKQKIVIINHLMHMQTHIFNNS